METRAQRIEKARTTVIEAVAEGVKQAFDAASIKYLSLNSGKDPLFPETLTKQIKQEIIDALSRQGYSDTQNEILYFFNQKAEKSKLLPATYSEFIGKIEIADKPDLYSPKDFKASGLCRLFFEAMSYDHDTGFVLPKSENSRTDALYLDFIRMIAQQADSGYLSQLKMESMLSDVPTVKTLRESHGFFSKGKERDTKRYKQYVAWLDVLLQNQSINEEKPSLRK